MLCLVNTLIQANVLSKTTYQMICHNCHAPQLATAIKAPAAFDKKAWGEQFTHAKKEALNNPTQFKNPIDYLLYSVKIGRGLMYHGGLCNESDEPNKNCSDKAFIEAIHYMSEIKP